MNVIRDSLKDVRASEELKKKTLQYLEEQRKSRKGARVHYVMRYMVAAVCVFLLLSTGGYSTYARPVSYISIDMNPSIELGLNQFDRVVSVNAYNEDGKDIIAQISLKNIPYLQAINRLLEDKSYSSILAENPLLVVTVISDHSDMMMEEMEADELLQMYGALTYASDLACMEEAHRHEMSFGKYRAYLELAQYDESITVEECHGMTIGEIHSRIESCQSHEMTGTEGSNYEGIGINGDHHEEPVPDGSHYEEPVPDGSHYEEPVPNDSHYEEPVSDGDNYGEPTTESGHHEEPVPSHHEEPEVNHGGHHR